MDIMTLDFNISNHSLTPASDFSAYSGNINYYNCKFNFLTNDWDNLSLFAVFTFNDTSLSVPITNDTCFIPSEVLSSSGVVYMGVFGTAPDKNDYRRLSTGLVCLNIGDGAYSDASAPETPTPSVWEQYYAEITKVGGYADRAEDSARIAVACANSASQSEEFSYQVMADLLKMMGEDIATLVDGKIPVSQIPSIATTEIHTASTFEEMKNISAQNGDICIRQDENKSYIYNNGWVFLVSPTDYASRCSYAETAGNAENANTINNHRIVEMTAEEFENAVKDPDTYYLVY